MAEAGPVETKEEYTKPIFKNGRFYNPWSTWEERGFFKTLKLLFNSENRPSLPSPQQKDVDKLVVLKPDFDKLNNPPKDKMQICWLGHACVLVQFDGISILADPVFSQRCSPTQYMGPKRYTPNPCRINELPHVDAVLISHTHYDHLDVATVNKLNAKFPSVHWFVPMKVKNWMTNCGCKNVQELSWWDEATIPGKDDFKFAFTPTQHFSNRSLFDMCKCLWGSWVVVGPTKRYFFGGDTAYCDAFKQIGRKFGPFDFAAIPIGAYEPCGFMSNIHVNPSEAVRIHNDIQSKKSLGIHWGTFVLTSEPILEPPKKLLEVLQDLKMNPEDFFVMQHGEVKEF